METFSKWIEDMTLIHGIKIILGIFNFWFWIRNRFWVPRYVHLIAIFAFCLGCIMLWLFEPGSKADNKGTKIFLLFLMPFIVYVLFVFFGGARESPLTNRKRRSNEFDRALTPFQIKCEAALDIGLSQVSIFQREWMETLFSNSSSGGKEGE